MKYVASKDYKKFRKSLIRVCGEERLKTAHSVFELFCRKWKYYLGYIGVLRRNFLHIEQLFNYSSVIKKLTKRGIFPNENILYKLLYLLIRDLSKKREKERIGN